MPRRTLTAGPGQLIGEVPAEMDRGLIDGVADSLIGHWSYGDTIPKLSSHVTGECPLCYGPLYRPSPTPVGRMVYRIGPVSNKFALDVMIDLLPVDRDLVACPVCKIAYTRPNALTEEYSQWHGRSQP